MSEKKKPKAFATPAVPPPKKPSYDVPKWAGKPPAGMHLDVMKGDKLIEKFIVDGKDHYFFGRQREFIDFVLDHTSCSRVHAVMVYHKNLHRMFLVDLGSVHGTFLGHIQLEANRPMQLAIDDTFRFGASSRSWTLREKPTIPSSLDTSLNNSSAVNADGDISSSGLLGLPESETEVDDLTEFNTAHNRRLATLPVTEPDPATALTKRKRKKSVNVAFVEGETIINPEDVDPTIGRFRNLVSTEIVIPNKKLKSDPASHLPSVFGLRSPQDFIANNLYGEVVPIGSHNSNLTNIATRITSAPDVEAPNLPPKRPVAPATTAAHDLPVPPEADGKPQGPLKKVYVKEAWPGRKPKGQNLLSV